MNETIDLGRLYGFSQCSPEGCGMIMPNNVVNTGGVQTGTAVGMENMQPSQTPGMSTMPPAVMNDQMIVSNQYRNTLSETGTNVNSDMMQQQSSMDNPAQLAVTCDNNPTLNSFIRTQVGRRVRAEFHMGSNGPNIRDGYLVGVGSNYVLINEIATKVITAGDFFNLKFISFMY